MNTDEFAEITASSGVDQGCPLSAFGLAAAMAPTVQQAVAHVRNQTGSGTLLWTYLDDWYRWIRPDKIKAATHTIEHAKHSIRLELQMGKTQIWLGNGKATLDADLPMFVTRRRNGLGGQLKIQGDMEDTGRHGLADATTDLCQAGLKNKRGVTY